MPIPDYQSLMSPVLEALDDGEPHRPREVITALGDRFRLTDDELAQLLPSGRIPVFNNRVHWAATYMRHAGLISNPARGVWRITDEGRRVLRDGISPIDSVFLRRYPTFLDWERRSATRAPAGDVAAATDPDADSTQTPEEILERAWRAIRTQVAGELLDQILAASPQFFERLVIQLLVAMGYGGTYAEAARVTRATGDGGIDGIINEDRLGLDAIYVQAKRWQATVGRPDLQRFAGSLEGERAAKGVFITTSTFSQEALEYVKRIGKRVVLIDGARLAELMIDHQVGVAADGQYVVPRIDNDFFDE